ncbi:MAG: alpha/beta fold hydrolase [Chloroflexi bacterium]|nr:alpha/beta fold hydrolase [Chloroflexota bacterium]
MTDSTLESRGRDAAAPPPAWGADGPPDGPVIVFVHGSRLTGTSWGWVTSRLDDRFRCVRLDLPGHGRLGAEAFDLERAAGLVLEAIRAEGGGRPGIVVGLSLGGYVAIAAAAREPALVRGLVLAGASAEPGGPAAAAFRLFAWFLRAMPSRGLDGLNSWLFRRRYPPEVAEPIIADRYWSKAGAEAVRSLPATRFRERLLAYAGPILVINGDLDVVFRIGARSFLRGVPNVTRRTLRWTTHLSPIDRPAAFAAAVARFADRLPT